MDIRLATHESNALNMNNFLLRETEGDCDLEVRSGRFFVSKKFYFDMFYFKEFISQLIKMNKSLEGEAVLRAEFEDEHISVKCKKSGHVNISGHLIENYPAQELKFNFSTDQTVLDPLIRDLQKVPIPTGKKA